MKTISVNHYAERKFLSALFSIIGNKYIKKIIHCTNEINTLYYKYIYMKK